MAFFSGPVRGGQILIRVVVLRPDEKSQTALLRRPYAALVDTGATCSCVSPKVVADLALISEGKRKVMSATETTDTNLYHIGLHIPVAMRSADDAGDSGVVQYSVFQEQNWKSRKSRRPTLTTFCWAWTFLRTARCLSPAGNSLSATNRMFGPELIV